jgi:hypothetical protein
MSYEIINARRGTSIIRAEAPGTYTITLSALSTNTSIETVTDASIKRLNWSSNGYISIGRGATPNNMLSLYNSGEMRFDDFGYSMANGSTGNIVVTVVTGGSVVMEVSKVATYSTDLDKL